MTPTRDEPPQPSRPSDVLATESHPIGPLPLGGGAPRVLLVDADSALVELLREWLQEQGCRVLADPGDTLGAEGAFDLVIVDIAYPRQGGAQRVQRIAQAHPGTPILALSTMFFACVDCYGAVARALNVACVLPKPASREALNKAVGQLLSRQDVRFKRPRSAVRDAAGTGSARR